MTKALFVCDLMLCKSSQIYFAIYVWIGKVAWSQDYGAPIVAMYIMDNEGMKKIPFTSMAMETLDHLQGEVASEVWREQFLQYENDNRF